MRTVLILCDFSYSAFNAARYALQLSVNDETRAILCHSTVSKPGPSNGVASFPRNISVNKLGELKKLLQPFKHANTTIKCRLEQQQLADTVTDIVSKEAVDLIVAGDKGKRTGQICPDSNLIDLIDKVNCPLLIVPADITYQPVEAAIFACDLEDIEKIPVTDIRRFIQPFNCRLHILNVDGRNREKIYVERLTRENKLDKLFAGEHARYHSMIYNETVAGIQHFCNFYNAALLIVVHKKHGLLYNIIHRSITKKLSLGTSIPVLVLRETPGFHQN